MKFTNWLKSRLFRSQKARRMHRCDRWKRVVEQLEDRAMLATLYVDSSPVIGGAGADQFTVSGGDHSNQTGLTYGTNLFDTVQAAVSAASAGDTIKVSDGTYIEDVNINSSVSLLGSGAGWTKLSGAIGGDGATLRVAASNVTIGGFEITRVGNNVAMWNGALNLAGIAIQGQGFTGTVIRDNRITGTRTAIDINDSNGHTIRNNEIVDNRTGLIFRNQTDNLTVVENDISNNWTIGVLFLDASMGSNAPVQTSLNSTFSNNNISDNWYGQIVDRQSGGALPAAGTTNLKNFSGNWLGTTSPVITTANSAEPGYDVQIPVAYGGSAVPPGGQPDVAGSASANFDITPLLSSGTDTDVETTPGRGTFGFQGDFSGLTVTSQLAQTGAASRIQEGVNRVTLGGAVNIMAGTFTERLVIDKTGVKVIGQGIDVTVIDYTGQTTGQGGVYITGNNAELRDLTVTHSSPNTASVPRYGIKADFVTGSSTTAVNGVVIDSVKVSNSFRTGLDLNGVTNITVNNVSAINNGGAGIFMTDVKGADLSNITTSGNPWTGVSIATFGQFFPLGTSDIVFSGANIFGESALPNGAGQRNGGLQLELGNFFAPASPEPISWSNQPGDLADVTIQSADFGYMVSGHNFDNANVYRRFYQTLAQAQSAALDTPDHILAGSRYIQDADDSNDFGPGLTQFYVYDNPGINKMSIQGAVDASLDGDVINVAAGTYSENVTVNKSVTLDGAGDGTNPAVDTILSTPGNIVTVAANDVTVKDLRVSGGSRGIQVVGTRMNLEILNSTLASNGVGFRMGTADNLDGLTIADSTFDSNTAQGIAVFTGPAGSYLTNVSISDTDFVNNTQKGAYFEKLNNAVFDGITVLNSGTDPTYAFNNGIDINLKHGAYSNITIQNSEFSGSGVRTVYGPGGFDFAAALAIKARNDSPSYNTVPATLMDVHVKGNVFKDSLQNSMTTAIRIGEPGKNNSGPTGVVICLNDLSDGTFVGVDNTSLAAVDAEFNWWGTTNGAVINATLAFGNVDFTPWLLDSAFSGNNHIFTDGDASLVVNQATGQYTFDDGNGGIYSGTGATVKNGNIKIHDQSSNGKIDVTGSTDGTLSVSLKGKGKPRTFMLLADSICQ
jgi:hypothetical protein